MLCLPRATGALLLLGLCACGGSAAATTSTPGAAATPGAGGRGGAAGELVQLNGQNLVLNTRNGDVVVRFSSTTPVQRTSTGTVADIVAGTCITATGQKDATGAPAISAVLVSGKVGGTCAPARASGDRGPAGPTPSPGTTPRARPANLVVVRGEVTAVHGTAVTMQPSTGTAVTITVPTTVRVARSQPASTSDLAVGECVSANGSRDGSGAVTARSLQIVPAGPSGCFTGTGGRGFGGGFGGGGGAGSGGNAGGPPAGAPPLPG